ncbi:MAG: hypothetical protein Sapg2KO_21290 [Saprospiraceae bacterium]
MPKRSKLRVGDKIRLLSVPPEDLEQRKREIAEGIENPGWTANTIELIIAQDPIVVIDFIDEYDSPWYVSNILVEGKKESHIIAVLEDDSWEKVKK